jgi:hypothetical protein
MPGPNSRRERTSMENMTQRGVNGAKYGVTCRMDGKSGGQRKSSRALLIDWQLLHESGIVLL